MFYSGVGCSKERAISRSNFDVNDDNSPSYPLDFFALASVVYSRWAVFLSFLLGWFQDCFVQFLFLLVIS